MLKKLAIGAAVLVAAAMATSSANAYSCYARSPTGSAGWGSSRHLSVARAVALRYCAADTPPPNRCKIVSCQRRLTQKDFDGS
jgi:hypothetical protein